MCIKMAVLIDLWDMVPIAMACPFYFFWEEGNESGSHEEWTERSRDEVRI